MAATDTKKLVLVAVDLQRDFALRGGKHFRYRPSVLFLIETLFPFFEGRGIAEIVSDYQQPRPGDSDECCVPGTAGYESIVPRGIVRAQWVKCMNSPIWIRERLGGKLGLPYQNPVLFDAWLSTCVGKPSKVIPVVVGLTIDCCVLCVLQELSWRGYKPLVLEEGVDHYTGRSEDKEAVLKCVASNWANVVPWKGLQRMLELQSPPVDRACSIG